jgi:hypothetical protein
MPAIPERTPIGDVFTGSLLKADASFLLAPAPLPDAETIKSGELIVRYGVRYLGKPHRAIVPGLVALDYGDMLTDEDAWTFILTRSNLHPRADVLGYDNEGRDEMILVKQLDLALPFQVLVYEDTAAAAPLAEVEAYIGPPDEQTATRIREYLPRFNDLNEWRAQRSADGEAHGKS